LQGQIQLVRGFKPVEAKALTDYKVPSLKGVWCRGHYLHEGSAASLEEMFDPARLEETHVPADGSRRTTCWRRRSSLRHDGANRIPFHVSQTEMAALKLVSELRVIHS